MRDKSPDRARVEIVRFIDPESHRAAIAARLPLLEENSRRNVEHVREDAGRIVSRHARRVAELKRSTRKTVTEKLAEVWDMADELTAVVAPYGACQKGCSHCCHISVGLTFTEAQLVGKRIGVKPAKVRPGRKNFLDVPWGYDHPCPFLDREAGACTIYEDRPLACRQQINLDDDALLCIPTPPETNPVPYLDMRLYTLWSLEVTAGGGVLGDIREFFPGGEHG